ncbi:MAG: endonuclease [Bacteroidota bacterium]|nr:endonuclease [Bacteroidota bacterium]
MNNKLIIILFFFLPFSLLAQTTIFSGQKGSTLINSLYLNYKPSIVLSYSNARDEMWGADADKHGGKLVGVYTGFTITIDPNGEHPRTEAYNKGINCEHTWPKSKGAGSGNAESDLHHLFPTLVQANSIRGSYPFADIPDDQADKWLIDDNVLTSKPSSNIDDYSEFDNSGYFEPREDHKGNVARAMFYFYTMYKSQADQSFFEQQKETLYKWHYQDPVDTDEIWRNDFVASKQSNKKNPFILDSTLIRRAYFPDYSSIDEEEKEPIKVFPNPFHEKISFSFEISQPSYVQILIFDSKGKILKTHLNFYTETGKYAFDFMTDEMDAGYYYYNFILNDKEKSGEIIRIK